MYLFNISSVLRYEVVAKILEGNYSCADWYEYGMEMKIYVWHLALENHHDGRVAIMPRSFSL